MSRYKPSFEAGIRLPSSIASYSGKVIAPSRLLPRSSPSFPLDPADIDVVGDSKHCALPRLVHTMRDEAGEVVEAMVRNARGTGIPGEERESALHFFGKRHG